MHDTRDGICPCVGVQDSGSILVGEAEVKWEKLSLFATHDAAFSLREMLGKGLYHQITLLVMCKV